ncbi:MAG: YbhB/YbcL family Raf kinase inhibitor-like protein [Thaumarchaeota archaeon]|nr:YbhB/YbcL family Raf kinase inhibitor-like protein [Nitrososphaerota archaeon]
MISSFWLIITIIDKIKECLTLIVKISSTAFENNDTIPSEFTCDGDDISPPLAISEVPTETKSLAIVMDDPDAPMGTFTHWVVWNIPPQKTRFIKGEKISYPQGKTSFGRKSYGGPCPPSGKHRYFFKIYALNLVLNLKEGSSKADLEKAMAGHILTEASLIGKYSRR